MRIALIGHRIAKGNTPADPFIRRRSLSGYSAIDFGLVDPHYGTLDDWVNLIDAMHRKGMYLIADFTVGTMGDLIGFKGHLNTSTPFSMNEYDAVWKLVDYAPWGLQEYPDFKFNNGERPVVTKVSENRFPPS